MATDNRRRSQLGQDGGSQIFGRGDLMELVTDPPPMQRAILSPVGPTIREIWTGYNTVVRHWSLRERRRGGQLGATAAASIWRAAPEKPAVLGKIGEAAVTENEG